MDNADLERLRISPGRLIPKFNSNVTKYNVTLGSEVSETKLTTITSDSGASIVIKGDANSKVVQLTEGKTSVVEIVVTAEDGRSTKVYLLSIHRLSADDAFLSQLETSVGDLQPRFSPSSFTYYIDLPSNVSQLAIKTKAEDAKIKVSNKGVAPLGAVPLSAGLTIIDILVTSPNGKNTNTYTINALRLRSPYVFQLNSPSPSLQCAVCSSAPHCPCRIANSSDIYCRECLTELSRVNKLDPMESKPLGEGWLILDQETDKLVSEQNAISNTPFGKLEGTVSTLPAMISQKYKDREESTTVPCEDCSKKVLKNLVNLHKQLFCSAKLSEPPFKAEIKQSVNVSQPAANLDEILAKAKTAEDKYLTTLRDRDPTNCSSADIIESLKQAESCYATAIQTSPKDPRGYIGLGLVMEEMFYIHDMYGIKDSESSSDDQESDAEISSKEEEFLAICKLHGVSETASLAHQLRAVEAEYKSLKQNGQGHKAEHVQQLYQWKSKKALEASKGSYVVDTESLLYKARVKYENAVSARPTDHSACYHLGRLCLLLGDLVLAEKCLKSAASIKPTHPETLLCLGKVISQSIADQAKPLIMHGLDMYITVRGEVSVGQRSTYLQSFHGNEFWRPSNTLIGESFLTLGSLQGHSFLDESSCYKTATSLFSLTPGIHKGSTLNQLLWILIRARAGLAVMDIKNKSQYAGSMCRQVSALINHCQLPPTEELRTLQMKVFEDGVVLEPTNSVALMRLGAGQFQQYEATNDHSWLDNAERSFRASIACENKPDNGTDPPNEILEQPWWKKRKEVSKPATTAPVTSTATTATTKQATTKAPVTTSAAKQATTKAPVKPITAGTKTTTPATKQSTTTSIGGRGTATSTGGRGRQPVKPVPSSGAGRGGGGRGGPQISGGGAKGRGVATLGELKSGTVKKPATTTPTTKQQQQKDTGKTETPKQEGSAVPKAEADNKVATTSTKPSKLNEVTYHPRLGLARVLAKHKDSKTDESVALYNEVIKMAPHVHDAYIELGEILAKTDPVAAVSAYSKFPFSDPPSFDDAYLHGEIVRLLMSSGSYDDPQLTTSMIAMGKALGIGVLDKTVAVLEAKFKTKVLKKVYAGVHGKDIDNPELQAFFKFKCWT